MGTALCVYWIRKRDLSQKVPVSSEMLLPRAGPFRARSPAGSPGSLLLSLSLVFSPAPFCILDSSSTLSPGLHSASRLALWLLDGSCHLPTVPGIDRRVVGRSRVRGHVCVCADRSVSTRVWTREGADRPTWGAFVWAHSCLLGVECCSCLLPKASILTFIFLKKSLPFWEVDRLSLAPQEG